MEIIKGEEAQKSFDWSTSVSRIAYDSLIKCDCGNKIETPVMIEVESDIGPVVNYFCSEKCAEEYVEWAF